MKRALGVGLSVLLVLGVIAVAAINWPRSGSSAPGCDEMTQVRGVVGSEKQAFFDSEAVRSAFARRCLTVKVDPAGSREIGTTVNLDNYDFAFPASTPSAQKIQEARKIDRVYTPFSSPMAVATFSPLVELLTKAGVVSKSQSGHFTLDMAKYIDLVRSGTRWDALPGNTAYKVRKNVLVTTTDPRDSNSAAMYLSIVSYVANGDTVVQNAAAEQKVLPTVIQTFLPQGGTADSTAVPFEDYLSFGMGKTPMALIYESQFVDAAIRNDSRLTPNHQLLYPSPTIFSKHTLVPLKDTGRQIGELLMSDQALVDAAAKAGFRTADPQKFADAVKDLKTPIAVDISDVIEPPRYQILERLLDAVGKEYDK